MGSLFSLQNKVAIVTGAGKETGTTIALEMATAGADVVVAARTAGDVEAAAQDIRALGRRSISVPTDVREAEQVDILIESELPPRIWAWSRHGSGTKACVRM